LSNVRDLFFDEFYDELGNVIKGIEALRRNTEPHLFINKP